MHVEHSKGQLVTSNDILNCYPCTSKLQTAKKHGQLMLVQCIMGHTRGSQYCIGCGEF